MAGTVSWISFAPVKGMRVQALDEVELTSLGVPGDRAFFLADDKGAMVNGKRLGSLMEVVPEHDPLAGTLSLRFPDGSEVGGEVITGAPETVTFFGNEETARPVAGQFSAAISEHVGQELRLMASPEGRGGVDRGKVGRGDPARGRFTRTVAGGRPGFQLRRNPPGPWPGTRIRGRSTSGDSG